MTVRSSASCGCVHRSAPQADGAGLRNGHQAGSPRPLESGRLLGDSAFGRRPFGRAALRALATLVVAGVPCRHALAQTSSRSAGASQRGGCSLTGDEAREVMGQNALRSMWAVTDEEPSLMSSSGDERLDAAFGQLLADMAGRFEERPGFGFIDDSEAPNAYATRETYLPNTRGTVLMGATFLRQRLSESDYGDILVMAVTAHEFAHIKQFFHLPDYGLEERLRSQDDTVKYMELHADFLAGYYIGRRATAYSEEQLVTLGQAWEASGDTMFHDPRHHGTHAERIAAIENGFRMAVLTQAGIGEAIDAGLYYLRA